MADVTITYKDNVIAEMNGASTKTLKTSGTYCEGDIKVSHTSNSRTYEITLSQASGWVLLTTLDADVLEHINDASLAVMLVNVSGYVYEYYTLSMATATNCTIGAYNSTTYSYGLANRQAKETTLQQAAMFYPANNTGTSMSLGGYAMFRVNGSKYYVKPADGYVRSGTYKLIFTW